jgi:hypothetical protein
VALERALAERALQVQTCSLGGEELASHARQRNHHVTGSHAPHLAGRKLVDAADGDEVAHRAEATCKIGHVATILLVGVDLYFRGKLEALLDGHHLVTSDSADWPDLVIADVGRIEPEEVADAYPEIPILGFTNHKDTSGLRRAHEAGFDQVVAKSALVERATTLVEELAT